jgi:GMP synthase-like glutamine amidotransferase
LRNDLNANYTLFDVIRNSVPTVEELKEFDGVILSGSSISTYEEGHSWIPQMEKCNFQSQKSIFCSKIFLTVNFPPHKHTTILLSFY